MQLDKLKKSIFDKHQIFQIKCYAGLFILFLSYFSGFYYASLNKELIASILISLCGFSLIFLLYILFGEKPQVVFFIIIGFLALFISGLPTGLKILAAIVALVYFYFRLKGIKQMKNMIDGFRRK